MLNFLRFVLFQICFSTEKDLIIIVKFSIKILQEKVGLLIGKQGRNIKTLKHETGADIMVHAIPFREDIQVLQIIGMI